MIVVGKKGRETVNAVILAMIIVLVASCPVCAETEKLGRDDFVSSTISDVFEKVGQYTSGEKRLFDRYEERAERGSDADATDPLGRTVPDPAIKPLKRPAASE